MRRVLLLGGLWAAAALAQPGSGGIQVTSGTITRAPVPNSPCDLPAAETEFLTTDPSAWIVVTFTGGSPGEIGRFEWVRPSGEVFSSQNVPQTGGSGSPCFVSSLAISGAPPASTPGTWRARLSWNNREQFDMPFRISVPPPGPVRIVSSSLLPTGVVGAAYSTRLAATGGVAPLRWSAEGLPPGLSLSSDGAVTGTPLAPGSFRVRVRADDAAGASASASVALPVSAPSLAVQPLRLSFAAEVGTARQTATVTVSSTGSNVRFTAAASTARGGNWLAVSASGASTVAVLTVTANPAGLTAGGYEGELTLTASEARPTTLRIPVSFTITPAGIAPANARLITTVVGTDWIFPDGIAASDAPFAATRLLARRGGRVLVPDRDNFQFFEISGGRVNVIAGSGRRGYSGDGGPARSASFSGPHAAVEFKGALYLCDNAAHAVRKVDAAGIITTVAGTGERGFSGDGGLAVAARLNSPTGLAVDSAGNLYIADEGNRRIRRVTPDGVIDTFAGTGAAGDTGDGGPARAATFRTLTALAADPLDNLYVSDGESHRVRRIGPDGVIRAFAGTGTRGYSGDNGPAAAAQLALPAGLAFDEGGNLLIADRGNNQVRRVAADGTITSAASGPGLTEPFGVAAGEAGEIFVTDGAQRIVKRITASGSVVAAAGTVDGFRFAPDGTPAASGYLSRPRGLAFDRAGQMLISDTELGRIRAVTMDGSLRTLAGRPGGRSGNGPALTADIGSPAGMAVDSQGNVIFVELGGRLMRLTPAGQIQVIASGFRLPQAVALDTQDRIYVGEAGGHRVIRVNADGSQTAVAGAGEPGFSGDNGPAAQARLQGVAGLAFDRAGNLFVSDSMNCRVRRITPGGVISTVAGTGACASTGDGGPASRAALNVPSGIAIQDNVLYILERDGHRVRVVMRDGTIATLAGSGESGFSGDGGAAPDARLASPEGQIFVTPAGNVFFTDTNNNRVRLVLGSPPGVRALPSQLTFTGASGSGLTDPQTIVTASVLPGLAFTAAATTTAGGDWLRIADRQGALPARIAVQADPGGLAPGVYRGSVVVTVPGASPATLTVPVTFNVVAPAAARLAVAPAGLTFQISRLRQSKSLSLTVTNPGSGSVDFNVSTVTFFGGPWLSASVSSATAAAGSPREISVTAASGVLAPGTYTGRVFVSSAVTGQKIDVPVTLLISRETDRPATLLLSQTGLTFLSVRAGGVTPPRPVRVINIGEGSFDWTAETVYVEEGPNWLEVAPARGTAVRGSPSLFFVRANTAGLEPGDYYALIRVAAPDSVNSPLDVQVVLSVRPDGSRPGLAVDPGGLVFVSGSGGRDPGAQTIEVTNLDPRRVALSAGASTSSGGNWLSVQPDRATLAPGATVTLSVFAATASLPADAYLGAVTLVSDDTPRTVPVRLVVQGGQGGSRSLRLSGGCTPSRILPVFTSLLHGFTLPAAWPAAVDVKAVDDCGEAMADGRVTVSFTNGDPPVSLVPLGDGRWTGTAFPRTAKSDEISVVGDAVMDEPSLAGSIRITGSIQANNGPPVLASGGVVNAATNAPLTPLAPGSLATIYGSGLVDGPDVVAGADPLPTELSGTQVLFAGRRLPLFAASNGQVSAVLPVDIPPNTQFPLLVRRGRTISGPELVSVASASPGIFTPAGTGSGQGLIYGIRAGGGSALADAGNPVRAGDRIAIFAAGLGETNPVVAAGQAAPAEPAAVRGKVSVQIGGLEAEVAAAFLSPGRVGVYEVTTTVPAGTPAGDAVPVTISVDGQTSPAVTIAVR